ncbi:MAG: hypothetical protein H0V34_09855 [Gammaproteobacteria bacterium]|nr:hypothetical protein [Gammaproteobacteria bacterium]
MLDALSQLSLSEWKDVAAVVGVAIALGTLLKGVIEYSHQDAQKRAEHFLNMRKRLKDNSTLEELCALLEVDDPKLVDVPFKDKRSLLGFFEEISLMMNSGLIRKAVAHYMFGYYAIRCWDSKHFWCDIEKNSIYWTVFREFVEDMKSMEKHFSFNRRHFRF